VPTLEGTHGARGLRALNTVDGAAVEAMLTQRDLQSGDLRVECDCCGSEREGRESGHDVEDESAHPPDLALRHAFPPLLACAKLP
jgi:hypothetical protein